MGRQGLERDLVDAAAFASGGTAPKIWAGTRFPGRGGHAATDPALRHRREVPLTAVTVHVACRFATDARGELTA